MIQNKWLRIKKVNVFSLLYFFGIFATTYICLLLFREFSGTGLYFMLTLFVNMGLWDRNQTFKDNFTAMLLISLVFWLTLMSMSFIFNLPVIGEGSLVIISFLGALNVSQEYNQDLWERNQIKYLI